MHGYKYEYHNDSNICGQEGQAIFVGFYLRPQRSCTCAHNGHVPAPTTVMYPCPQRPCTRAHNGHVPVPTTVMYPCPPRSCTCAHHGHAPEPTTVMYLCPQRSCTCVPTTVMLAVDFHHLHQHFGRSTLLCTKQRDQC